MVTSVRMVSLVRMVSSVTHITVTKGRLYDSWVRDHVIEHLGLNVSSSVHNCGCMFDGGNAMAAI